MKAVIPPLGTETIQWVQPNPTTVSLPGTWLDISWTPLQLGRETHVSNIWPMEYVQKSYIFTSQSGLKLLELFSGDSLCILCPSFLGLVESI